MAKKRNNPDASAQLASLAELGVVGGLFTMRLQRVGYLIRRATRRTWSDKKLRSGAIGSLSLIVTNPGISQTDIVAHTTFDKSAVNGIVNNLEELGWVERRTSQSDRRRYTIFPTAKGKAALRRIADQINATEARLLAELSEADRAQLLVLLDKLYHSCLSAAD